MSAIPNDISKKIIPQKIRHKRSSIPININIDLNQGKFLFSKNNMSKISSSYLSMGKKIKMNKIKQIPKKYENTNSISISNSRLINASSYFLNNPKNNSKNDICSINDKSNNIVFNYCYDKNQKVTKIEKHKIKFCKRIIHSKKKRQLSTSTNSNISSDLFIAGYKTSLNNKNNSKCKIQIQNGSITKNNISKIEQNYSSRANNLAQLESRNKTKKITMKSKLRLYKFNRPISTSFPIGYTTKRQIKKINNKNITNGFKVELFKKIDNNTNEKNNMIKNKNFYRIKNRHCRNNTTYFGQRDIMNILHKKFLSNKNNNNYNMNNLTGNTINNFEKNNINNICINNYKSKNKNIDKLQKFITKNIISKENSKNKSIINKVNYNIIQKEKISRMNKEISEGNNIYINENKIKLRENKINDILSYNNKNLNNKIQGIKITASKRRNLKTNKNIKDIYNQIPISTRKAKEFEIPSQRNIKLKFDNIMNIKKIKKIKNNSKIMKGKSNSLKKDLNGNITNFSLSKLNENNIIKNKNDDFDVKENKNKKKNYNNSKNKECSNNIKDSENNNIIVSNYFSNLMKLKIKDNCNKNLRETNSNNKLGNNLEINNDDNNKIDNIKNDTINKLDKKIEKKGTMKNNECKLGLKNNKIINDLFEEDNLDDLPEDYDEEFNDLYSIINKINFGRVLVGVEGFFTCEGKSYKKYKDNFDKFYDKLFLKKRNSVTNSDNKRKNLLEIPGVSSNAKTNYSSSKKVIINN